MKYLWRKKSLNLIIIFLVLITIACSKENRFDCFKSTGKKITIERSLMDFQSVVIYGNIDLSIRFADTYKIRLEGGENLLPLIKTEVQDTMLEIRNDNKCNWVRKLDERIYAELTVPDIDYLIARGSGDIKFLDTLTSDYFNLEVVDGSGYIKLLLNTKTSWIELLTGVADVEAIGKSGVNYVYVGGVGRVDARELDTYYSFVRNDNVNNIYIRVSKHLTATINYIGNTYYYGDPEETRFFINHSGKIIHLE